MGVALRDQALGRHRGPVDAALAGETLADMAVDLLAQRMARRHDPGVLALLRGEFEPSGGDRAGDIVGFHLGDVAAELLEGLGDVALEARLDGFLQRRIALAHDLVHGRGPHARTLELGEGLAGIDSIELLRVADQHDARNADFVGDAQQVPCLDGRGKRALVDHQDRLRKRRPHLASHPCFVSRPSATPALRARNLCRVSLSMPASAASVFTAEAEGASPSMRQPFFPASTRARSSMVVLPVPA